MLDYFVVVSMSLWYMFIASRDVILFLYLYTIFVWDLTSPEVHFRKLLRREA